MTNLQQEYENRFKQNALGQNGSTNSDYRRWLEGELIRLREDNFSKKIHHLDKTLSNVEFCADCINEQVKLYGESYILDLLERAETIVNRYCKGSAWLVDFARLKELIGNSNGWIKVSDQIPEVGRKVNVRRATGNFVHEALFAFGCWRDYISFGKIDPAEDMEWQYCES